MNVSAELISIPTVFDVGLAPHSASNLYVDLDDVVRGVFVATYGFGAHAIGSHVTMRLHFPGGALLAVLGVVAWQRLTRCEDEPGCGVRFDRPLDMSEIALLSRFATYRQPLLFAS